MKFRSGEPLLPMPNPSIKGTSDIRLRLLAIDIHVRR